MKFFYPYSGRQRMMICICLLWGILHVHAAVIDSGEQFNVLFISVDDLRPELNCYGREHIVSPHIDRLAAEGFLFKQAYCNVPVCGASRASILTGLRPTPRRFLAHNSYINEDAADVVTLPALLKEHGYHTESLGKVLHHWKEDSLNSWSEAPWHPSLSKTGSKGRLRLDFQLPENANRRMAFENAEVPDTAYIDGKIAARAVERLSCFSKQGIPFFLAVGFVKPHLPFNAPSSYWELYDAERVELPDFIEIPEAAPAQANHNSNELRTYDNIPGEGSLNEELSRELIRGYYACVSYVDAQIGKLLEALKDSGLEDNTIVVLWGDHGYSLKEHSLWNKHSTFEVALRVPLILKVPGVSGGAEIGALTELLDLYPTVCDLLGIAQPDHLQGDSFVPILHNPRAMGKEVIYGRWKEADFVKTQRYLYTEWFDDDESMARMLYDHHNDPHETVNIAELPENRERVAQFSKQLREMRKL